MIGLNLHWIYAHLIGDYLLQNDWMAVGKKKSHWINLIHVFTYMLPFLLTSMEWWQLLLIATQHYIQDKWGFINWFCRITGKFQRDVVKVWGHIIVDNVFHILWMYLVSIM
jgi:hypothetical protein